MDFKNNKKYQGGKKMLNLVKRLVKEEEAQGLTEYALILGGIVIAVVFTLISIGGKVAAIFEGVDSQLADVPTATTE